MMQIRIHWKPQLSRLRQWNANATTCDPIHRGYAFRNIFNLGCSNAAPSACPMSCCFIPSQASAGQAHHLQDPSILVMHFRVAAVDDEALTCSKLCGLHWMQVAMYIYVYTNKLGSTNRWGFYGILMPYLDTHSSTSSSWGSPMQYLSMLVMQFGESSLWTKKLWHVVSNSDGLHASDHHVHIWL